MSESTGANAQQAAPKLEIQKIYVKDASWEAPNSPQIFQNQWKPELNIELKNQAKVIEGNDVEVSIQLTITCRNQKKIAFIIEMEQAGLFTIENIEGQERERVIGVICPNTLFPYVREYVDSVAMKGGFAPVALAPINFDAIFAQAIQKRKEQQEQAGSDSGESQERVTH